MSKTAVKTNNDLQAREVRRNHPMPPPGVQSFDIRRFRRRDRKRQMGAVNRLLADQLSAAEEAKKALVNLIGDRDRKQQQFDRTFLGRTVKTIRRVFGHRTGSK